MTRLCAVIGAVLLCGALGAVARARSGSAQQRLYTLRFHRVDRHGAAWTAGDWVLLGPGGAEGARILRGTLTNERTGFPGRGRALLAGGGAAGRDGHDLPTVEYVNLATGEVVPDPVQVGGTAYPAMSDPGLVRVAMWSARPGELGGVRGGTGARFVARYPRALGGPGGINALDLSTRTIYLGTWTGQVWAAALPRALR